MLFEMHMFNNTPYIQIFYKNSTFDPKPLNIPNCGTLCPLEKMFELYHDILPGDFDLECKLKKEKLLQLVDKKNSTFGTLITGIVLSAFLAVALVTMAIKIWGSKKKYGPTKRTDP